jgi:hypothetical protein
MDPHPSDHLYACVSPSIAVGTKVTLRPPRRSERAELLQTAPASSHDMKRWLG